MAYETIEVASTAPLMRPGVESKQTPDEMAVCVRETLAISGAMDGLTKAITELEQRLYQVLLPCGPSDCDDKPMPDVTSPLHGAMRDINERVGLAENHIYAIMRRLTV